MQLERISMSFTPRRSLRRRSARQVQQPSEDGQMSLQYFIQVLDIDTVCQNALRSLRMENENNDRWIQALQQDDWMYKFEPPISVKF